MAKPCCERSEPASAAGAARVWGADSPPRFRGDRIAGQFLAAGENLALQRPRFLFRPFFALVAIEDVLPEILAGY